MQDLPPSSKVLFIAHENQSHLEAFEKQVLETRSSFQLGLIQELENVAGDFTAIFSGLIDPLFHSDSCLLNLSKLASPSASLVLVEPCVDQNENSKILRSPERLKSLLLLNGWINISFSIQDISEAKKQELAKKWDSNHVSVLVFKAKKPDYKVGASSKLNFKKSVANDAKKPEEKVWKITMDDDELLDEDTLLDDEDKKAPILQSCGTTRKKACNNCSCGLAEEEAKAAANEEVVVVKKSVCYLGDAFRCGGCPYLGMPAFNPGEKVSIGLFDDL